MDEGGAAFGRAEAASRQVARMHQARTRRTAGHADGLGWRDVVVDRQLAAGEGFGGGEGGGDLVVGRCGVEAGARGGGQRCGHFMALVGAASAAIVGLTTPANAASSSPRPCEAAGCVRTSPARCRSRTRPCTTNCPITFPGTYVRHRALTGGAA